MIAFTPEMKDALAKTIEERMFCLVATANAEGWPNVSYRGSVAVLDDQTLTIWNRSRKDTIQNIEENPRVCIFYRSRERQASWRFLGRARIAAEGAQRDQVMRNTPQLELDADPERKGIGVFVTVERILDGTGAAIQEA